MHMVQTPAYTHITSYNVEGIFFGMNCVLYAFCVYTLWGQKSISCRLLLLVNTVQFLLCVIQLIFHTIFLFIVFAVLTGDIQLYLSHKNVYILTSTIIYGVNYITAGFVSIWRLCVLYDNEIRVCIPAFIIWIAQICTTALVFRVCATIPIARTTFNLVNMLLWALITTLNICIAIQIVLRLCIAQKRTHTILSPSPYESIAIVLVECGALITVCSVAMTILYACNYAYALANRGAATEIAIASQLLVTARHGMLSQGRGSFSPTLTPLETNVMSTESRHNNPLGPVVAETPCSFAGPSSRDQTG